MEDFAAFGIEIGKGKYYEEAFYGLILVYTLLFDKMAKYLNQYGLTPAKLNVMMVIKHQGGAAGLSQREIGARLMVTPSNMTRLLDKLEREKLIERKSRPGDRRVKVICISKRGSQILDEAWPGYLEIMRNTMNKIDVEDQKALSAILINWFQRLKN